MGHPLTQPDEVIMQRRYRVLIAAAAILGASIVAAVGATGRHRQVPPLFMDVIRPQPTDPTEESRWPP
jgi:hypothetical protein